LPTNRAQGGEGDPAAAAVRAAMQQAMASDEPPIRPGIIGGALVGARRVRRWRRLAGAGALAAIVPAVAIGIAAAPRAAGPTVAHGRPGTIGEAAPGPALQSKSAPDSEPSSPQAQGIAAASRPELRRAATSRPALREAVVAGGPGANWFVRPVLPAAHPAANLVPITTQSFAQLLLDQLPADAVHTQVMATVDAVASQDQLSLANFDQVTTARGEGSVSVQLIRASTPGAAFGCAALSAGESCRTFMLGSGVAVNETAVTAPWESDGTLLAVIVYRPGTGLISIEENSSYITGAAANVQPPLTLRQLVRAALDPRWGYTIGKAFAVRASRLYVLPASQG
jgi:hypothetical protein